MAWYRAENNGVDSVGPNFATANGGATYATGEVGQAFSLNGTTAYVSAPDNASLHPASLTVEGWFKIIGTTGVRMLASKSIGTGVENSFLVFIAADGTIGAGVATARRPTCWPAPPPRPPASGTTSPTSTTAPEPRRLSISTARWSTPPRPRRSSPTTRIPFSSARRATTACLELASSPAASTS